ncbi:hypothetical protein V5H98_07645 [Georgenia sp. M64]|uniref:hypothetical protein n=1 Tax=Georgenia sp. M64 TaxID=3120520 RepID=UPI0030E0B751
MTTTIGTDPGTASVQAHDAAVESELIRLTDALLAAVGARETHELAQRALMPVLCDQILPQVAAEQIVFGDTPAAPRTDLVGAAMAAQERHLIGLVAEVDHAATGIEAVRAADAVAALPMIRAEEMTVPALAAYGSPVGAAAPTGRTPTSWTCTRSATPRGGRRRLLPAGRRAQPRPPGASSGARPKTGSG